MSQIFPQPSLLPPFRSTVYLFFLVQVHPSIFPISDRKCIVKTSCRAPYDLWTTSICTHESLFKLSWVTIFHLPKNVSNNHASIYCLFNWFHKIQWNHCRVMIIDLYQVSFDLNENSFFLPFFARVGINNPDILYFQNFDCGTANIWMWCPCSKSNVEEVTVNNSYL